MDRSTHRQKLLQNQAGQVLLIVILILIIVLTVGLSIASRSITTIRTSTDEASSQKALSAAEAGIEQTIQSNIPIATPRVLPNSASYSTNVTAVLGTNILLHGDN